MGICNCILYCISFIFFFFVKMFNLHLCQKNEVSQGWLEVTAQNFLDNWIHTMFIFYQISNLWILSSWNKTSTKFNLCTHAKERCVKLVYFLVSFSFCLCCSASAARWVAWMRDISWALHWVTPAASWPASCSLARVPESVCL